MMLSSLSQRTEQMQPSLIRAIADRALGQKDVIPLMFGEGCWPTSDIAVHALQDALASNDHFYHPNSGKPSLRRAIADYQSAHYIITRQPVRILLLPHQGCRRWRSQRRHLSAKATELSILTLSGRTCQKSSKFRVLRHSPYHYIRIRGDGSLILTSFYRCWIARLRRY